MRRIFKRKDFSRWMLGESLHDNALCSAIREMENGLIDAHFEKRTLQFTGKVMLELSPDGLSKALTSGVLIEVYCE